MDPRTRLERRHPGEGKGELRPVEQRLLGRSRPQKEERVIPGSSLRKRDAKVRKVRRTANPRPNAPLLKRIVRYPYRLETTSGRRFQLFEPAISERQRVESSAPAMRLAREACGRVTTGNPLRTYPTRVPRQRTLPSVNDWLAGGS